MDRFIYRQQREGNRSRNGSSFTNLFNSPLAKITLLIISAFLLYNVVHSVNITVQKVDILNRARVEVDALRLKNLELALLLDSMQSKEYLEVQARDRLNFAGEMEYIFVIPEEVLEEVGEDMGKLLGDNEQKDQRGVYEIWGEFLLEGI